MKSRIKSLLIFSLIFTILASLGLLLLDQAVVDNLGTQLYVVGLTFIACVLLLLSGYVWDRETVSDIENLKHRIESTHSPSPEAANQGSGGEEFAADGQNEIFGIARQIEQMAQSLQKVDARYRAIVEDQTDLVCRYLPDGTLTFINHAYCEAVGSTKEELLGNPFPPFSDGSMPEVAERIAQLSPDSPNANFEQEIESADGGKRWYQWSNRAIFDNLGRLFEHQAVGRDITERKNLEAQVRQSQRLDSIGQLAAGIAHDYNNILTVIQGHASLIALGNRPPETVVKSAQQICLATEHASNLSRQLLVFSNRQAVHIQPIDLNEGLNQLTKLLGRILTENIELRLDLRKNLPHIEADRGMMEQIVFNLAGNARDAMPDGGSLTITTSTEVVGPRSERRHPEASVGRFVRLTVTDTGCGIPAETQSKIFEPFFTTKGVGKGSGLGLATVYGIVKQHKGWIEIRSAPGEGTAFDIFLPAAETKARRKEDTPRSPESTRGTETVLLAEDEPVLRELIQSILEEFGYTVLENPSGVTALESWRENRDRIDILVTDLVMPDGLNGRELAQRILAEKPDMEVVYISGYSADVVGKDLQLKQGENFLQKPFEPHALAHIIRLRLDGAKGKTSGQQERVRVETVA